MDLSDEFKVFLQTMAQIEKDRAFDRKVDRLKKSSSAVTVWAVIPGLIGFFGIAHFYLNRPLEGLLMLGFGFVVNLMLFSSFSGYILPYYAIPMPSFNDAFTEIFIGLYVVFFIGNIFAARYYYSKYDFVIHKRAMKPWNNWGLQSVI